jgi:hydrogenase expression/formation protein HypE
MTKLEPITALRPRRKMRDGIHVAKVSLVHGGGGKAMRYLIDDVFVAAFDNPALAPLEDQARFALADLAQHGDRLAFTSDSFVIDPLEFPGGGIGKLAVCGTVNDLAVGGAKPLYLSCSVIIEEGIEVALLRKIARSMAETAAAAGVAIVTGDTKVVDRSACDKLFINTAGIGVIRSTLDFGAHRAEAGDVILVNGLLGDHGAAILAARGDLRLDTPIESDCAALNTLIDALIDACPQVKFIRDATRGGVATVLNEIAEASGVGIEIEERRTPLREEVKGFCEILGLDPLYLANEGKIVAVVPGQLAETARAAMASHPLGRESAIIGHVTRGPADRVVMQTHLGGKRIVDMLVGEQLPRIC